jgi:uncharacterized metal-binding protein YceD (DUF177 family)
MIIELNKLTNRTLRIARAIAMGRRHQPADGCFYASPVDVDLTITGSDEKFTLRGSIAAKLLCRSHRSLKTFELLVDESIEMLLIPHDVMHREHEVELERGDMNVSAYVDVIDLCDIIDEQVNLALPMRLISPDEQEKPELSYSSRKEGEEVTDSRLLVLKDIKDRMMKGNGKKSGRKPN